MSIVVKNNKSTKNINEPYFVNIMTNIMKMKIILKYKPKYCKQL